MKVDGQMYCQSAAIESYAAKMAGLPKAVIDRANQILSRYMENSNEKNNKVFNRTIKESTEHLKIIRNLIKEIDLIDINNTTPLQALEILTRLKKKNGL